MINKTYDIHIIGGGIIGLCSAISLQERGINVLIIEAEGIGQGASYGNAGHIATEQVFPIADASILNQIPAMLLNPEGPLRIDWKYLPRLLPWAVRLLLNMRPGPFEKTHKALLEINAHSLNAWENFAKKWDLQSWVKVNGSLLVAEKQQSYQELISHGCRLNEMGVKNNLLEQEELLACEPALNSNQLGALFFPDTGHITNLDGVIKQLVNKFKELGGEVLEQCRVINAVSNVNGIELTTTQGNILADKVMISTGAYSKALVKQLTGISVPLDTERGYHLMLPQEKDVFKVPVSSVDRRFIMTPMDGGLRLAGTVEYAGLEAPPNMNRAGMLLKNAQGMLKHSLNNENSTKWMGFRPSTSDSLPVIDKYERVFLNFGHQHLGLTQAVISSEIITALYFNEELPMNSNPYKIERFQ